MVLRVAVKNLRGLLFGFTNWQVNTVSQVNLWDVKGPLENKWGLFLDWATPEL